MKLFTKSRLSSLKITNYIPYKIKNQNPRRFHSINSNFKHNRYKFNISNKFSSFYNIRSINNYYINSINHIPKLQFRKYQTGNGEFIFCYHL